ncbi:MAG: protein kinase [bacterium]
MRPGTEIAHYKVVEKIGAGGMGEVYLARDTKLGRDVALKVLPAEFSGDPERLARFRNEAKLLAALNHNAIAAIHGLEEIDGHIFLAMEYVEGEDLSERIQREPLTLQEVLDLALQLSEGLEAAHARGVVHRDLKPANLRITPEGRLKILDFGLARAYAGDQPEGRDSLNSPTMTVGMTQEGTILGTAAYMSPEQARGRPIDHRTDIWAFGAILYEMLTGRRLFAGETVSDTVAAVLRAELDFADLPEDTPSGVRRLMQRCLERDGRRRLRDIGEARVRLERWREAPESIHESITLMGAQAADFVPRRTVLPWAVAAVAVLAAALLGWMQFRPEPAPAPRLTDWTLELPGEEDLPFWSGSNLLLSGDGNWYGWLTPEGVHVRRADSRDVRILPGTSNANAACFAPNNRWIAFTTATGLYRTDVTGGNPFRLCDAPLARGVAWVDPNTIVFTDAIATGLKKVDVASGEVMVVTEPDTTREERSHRWASVVPGKRGVLFMCQYRGRNYDTSDIEYLDLDTGERKTVHRGGAFPRTLASGTLLFVREHTLYARDLDLGTMQAAGLPVAVRTSVASSVGDQEDDDGAAQYVVDDQGTLFYMDTMGAGRRSSYLAWLDFADGSLQTATPVGEYRDYVLSPDGTKVLASIFRDGDYNLFVLDLEKGTDLMITNRMGMEYAGVFSPDSRRVYWTQGSDTGARFEIWSRLADGSVPAEPVTTPASPGGVWVNGISPDSRLLVGTCFAGNRRNDLYIVDLQDPAAEAITFASSGENENDGQFIGDGGHIIYGVTSQGGGRQVFIRRYPDSGAVWSLPASGDGWWDFSWSDAAGGVVAIDDRGIVVIPVTVDGDAVAIGSPRLLLDPRTQVWVDRAVALKVHADGSRGLVHMLEGEDEDFQKPTLAIVTGWGQEVHRQLQAAAESP